MPGIFFRLLARLMTFLQNMFFKIFQNILSKMSSEMSNNLDPGVSCVFSVRYWLSADDNSKGSVL